MLQAIRLALALLRSTLNHKNLQKKLRINTAKTDISGEIEKKAGLHRYWSDRKQVQKGNGNSTASQSSAVLGSNGSLDRKINQLEAQNNIEVCYLALAKPQVHHVHVLACKGEQFPLGGCSRNPRATFVVSLDQNLHVCVVSGEHITDLSEPWLHFEQHPRIGARLKVKSAGLRDAVMHQHQSIKLSHKLLYCTNYKS